MILYKKNLVTIEGYLSTYQFLIDKFEHNLFVQYSKYVKLLIFFVIKNISFTL